MLERNRPLYLGAERGFNIIHLKYVNAINSIERNKVTKKERYLMRIQ